MEREDEKERDALSFFFFDEAIEVCDFLSTRCFFFLFIKILNSLI